MVGDTNLNKIQIRTKEAILELISGGQVSHSDLLDKLLCSNILSERHCKIALIRKRYYELVKTNSEMKYAEAQFICEDEFGVSEEFVRKAIYRYRGIDFEKGFK